MLKRLLREDEGVLTFEWILLLTLLVIGVIGGIAGIRDAIIHECQGVVGAVMSLWTNPMKSCRRWAWAWIPITPTGSSWTSRR